MTAETSRLGTARSAVGARGDPWTRDAHDPPRLAAPDLVSPHTTAAGRRAQPAVSVRLCALCASVLKQPRQRSNDPRQAGIRRQTLITSVSSFTAAADFFSDASSSAVSLISMICSTPRAPSFTGTPTKRSRMPYPPCRNTEHGTIFFLSLRMISTISAAADPGAYHALVPTSLVISAPPSAVRLPIASIRSLVSPG